MSSLTLENVTKIFSGNTEIVAVDDANLEISDGEFMVLVGPSGSGKSTLLRLIAGLEAVSEGVIRLDGTDITDIEPKNRDIAMVFQNYALYPHLNARGNMSFGLKMRGGYSKEEIDSRVSEAAEAMDISDLLDKMPSELSGGQKQRVALGRATVRDPEAFLMDEPLSNLDEKLRRQMRTEIQRLQDDLGVTTIYVTHDQIEAMTMGDRIAIMNEGVIQQVATPLEAYYEPENMFVAGFIGSPSMNFFAAEFSEPNGVELHLDGTCHTFDEVLQQQDLDRYEDLTLGIRPEDIELTSDQGPQTIKVETDVVEPMGKEQLLHFKIGEATHTAIIEDVTLSKRPEFVHLRFPEEKIYIFNSGKLVRHPEWREDEDSWSPNTPSQKS